MVRTRFERCYLSGKNFYPGKNFWFVLALMLVCLLGSCSSGENKAILKVGDQAPDFTVTDLDGKVFSLSKSLGSPVVLRFFLTDCKFCRADTPVFNEYYKRFHAKGLRIIYIDTLGVNNRELDSFRRELAIAFPVASDTSGKIAAAYSVKALPQTVVLDPQHKIIAAILGGVSEAELKHLLSPYLPFK